MALANDQQVQQLIASQLAAVAVQEITRERFLAQPHFERLLAAAGLPRVHLYDPRHASAALLLAAGEHSEVVSQQLCHSSVTLTLDNLLARPAGPPSAGH
jgi:hypothetical protein